MNIALPQSEAPGASLIDEHQEILLRRSRSERREDFPSEAAVPPVIDPAAPVDADPQRGRPGPARARDSPGRGWASSSRCSSWYSKSVFTSQTSWAAPRMLATAIIAVSIEWSWLLYLWRPLR